MNAPRTPTEDHDETAGEPLASIAEEAVVGRELAGMRADAAAAKLFPDYSRARLAEWIRRGELRFDDRVLRPRDSLRGGERARIAAVIAAIGDARPECIPLAVLHQDADLLVIDKPAGLVVHPGAGNPTGTLVNALLHLEPGLAALPRAGIVHRLDKETSGCLLVARSPRAHAALVALLADRAIHRQYEAVVQGEPVAGGSIRAPIGRHPVDRLRMAVTEDGRPAVTHYRVRERFRGFASLQVNLETGRTHQIRVHMAHVRLPLVGDPLYGASLRLPRAAPESLIQALRGFRRQALHAEQLAFEHPFGAGRIDVAAPRPADLQALLGALRDAAQAIE